MKQFFCFAALVYAIVSPRPVEMDPYKGPEPVAVLIQTDPWLMVIGSDTPMAAIYGDGDVVYLERKNGNPSYFHKRLLPKELEKTQATLAGFGDYSKIKSHYNIAPNVTDQPETRIYLNLNGHRFVTRVYGLRVSNTPLPGYTVLPGQQEADTLPETLRRLHQYLTSLQFDDATPWQPEHVEVMIWEYEYAPDESIHWPKEWPGLESPSTIRRGDSYSIFLPGRELPRLRELLKTRKEKGAVEIGGKKWAVSYRYVFPSEPIWMRAFRDIR
jgi:hypothetical protein